MSKFAVFWDDDDDCGLLPIEWSTEAEAVQYGAEWEAARKRSDPTRQYRTQPVEVMEVTYKDGSVQ